MYEGLFAMNLDRDETDHWPSLIAGNERTQTIDLDQLFGSDTTESGSFDLRKIKFASFGKLLQALSVPTLLVDHTYRIQFVNSAFAGMTDGCPGWSGRRFSSLFPDPTDALELESLLATVLGNRKPVVHEGSLRIDTAKLWARIHMRTIRLGRERLVLVQIENLTAQKQLATVRKYRKLVRIFPIGIAELALQTPVDCSLPAEELLLAVLGCTVVDGNAEFANMYGHSNILELGGMSLGDLLPMKSKMTAVCESWVRSGFAPRSFETAEPTGSDSQRFYENTLIANVNDNNLFGLWLLRRDITEKKHSEQEIARSQKLESLGILAGGIAHDFNNLLTAMIGNISLLRFSPDLTDSDAKRLDAATKAAARAQELTRQLLTFSRGGAPIKKTASVGDVLKDAVEFALRGSSVSPEFSIPGDIWPIEMDEGQIHQVINNLVINAVQAMPSGGVLRAEAVNFPVDERTQMPMPQGPYVRIAVQDTGVGIPQEHLAKVFDPYFTTKAKGTGLGLATAYSIVKRHNGLMTLHSKVGVGSTFHFYLPASPDAPVSEQPSVPRIAKGTGRVLVMDDDEMIRNMAFQMLSILGYDVRVARDGGQAIDAYVRAREARLPFDAVIMDLTVRGGMGGREALAELKQIDPQVQAVASSGYSNNPIMSEFAKFGFVDVLPKPYDANQLSRVLQRIIGLNDRGSSNG